MLRALLLVLLGAIAARGFIAPIGPGQIEGPNVPDQPYIAYSGHNCIPQPAEDFVRCISFVRGPHDTSGEPSNDGAGTQAYSACQWHESDPLPSLPVGTWTVESSECPPPDGANCTGWLIAFRHTGGDGGCWTPDSAIGALLVRTAEQPRVRHGRCWYHADGRPPHCRWKDK